MPEAGSVVVDGKRVTIHYQTGRVTATRKQKETQIRSTTQYHANQQAVSSTSSTTVDHHELYALEQEPVGVKSRGAVSKKPSLEKTLAGDTWTSTAFDLWVDLRQR